MAVAGGGARASSMRLEPHQVAALVDLARTGDGGSFEQLYREHLGAVYAVLRQNISNPETVADLSQEVFVRALEGLPALRDSERFRPWLLSIARNASIDHLRSAGRVVITELDEQSEPEDDTAGPELLAELRALAAIVQGLVAGLRQRDATAISLVAHLGFSPAEVGFALGISEGAAKVVVHRARRRLRESLLLRLLASRRGWGCETLAAHLETDDITAGAQHAVKCPVCATLARGEAAIEVLGFAQAGASSV